MHHLCLLLLGGRLTLAPIDKPKRVLDVGTGTGIWAIAMADHLPEDSEIIGTDLSPIQPTWYNLFISLPLSTIYSPLTVLGYHQYVALLTRLEVN